MRWRFADLPVRTKFMVTLGIPVLGMVLLLGKQVDSNIKRSNVLAYIKGQSERIGQFANAMHEMQKESAYSVGHLTGRPVTATRLRLQHAHTDSAIRSMRDPEHAADPQSLPAPWSAGLDLLRERVLDQRIEAHVAARTYRTMDRAMLDELRRVGRLGLDPENKDRFYAHQGLLSAKSALSAVRDQLSIAFAGEDLRPIELAELSGLVSQYETNMLLFERDAPPEVLGTFRDVFQGSDVNFMRSIIGTVKERRGMDHESIAADQWWELSLRALDKLKLVEDHSLALIVEATAANSRDARLRLLIVLAALIGVVGGVSVMGVMIMRGVRSTVNEVTHAARSLALGDVGAEVPVGGEDEVGQMALSFNRMIENIRSLASSAESIGKGNYETPVIVRGPQDVLGNALSRMRENLKAARLRDDEQTLALQAEKAKLEEANERIHVLIKEMHHRVKNNLQVVASLLRLQASTIADERLQHAFDESQGRVAAMALIHEKLYKGEEIAKVDMAEYIQELFSELVRLNDVDDRIGYRTRIEPGLAFDLHTMVPLGLLLNELITNSFKHAFTGRDQGLIRLDMHRAEDGRFVLDYSDDGVGIPQEKAHGESGTLGVSLIESLVDQLNGRLSVEGSDKGTRYHIRFMPR